MYFTILGDAEKRYYAKLKGTEPAPQNFLDAQSSTASKPNSAVFYNALFDVPNPDHRLRISMTAQVHIVREKAKDVLTVPVAATGDKNGDGSFPVRVVDAQGEPRAAMCRPASTTTCGSRSRVALPRVTSGDR